MVSRPTAPLAAKCLARALLLGAALASLDPRAAWAGGADDDAALEAARLAMEEDFLNTQFRQAAQKLQAAITQCGKKCSPKVVAQLYCDLGIVHFNGLSDARGAQAAFEKAVATDPNVLLDPRWSTPDLLDAFEKAGGLRVAAIVHDPVAEQKLGTAVPIYAELPRGLEADQVTLYWRKAGKKKFKKLRMKKGMGYRAKIPCEAVRLKGSVEYYIAAESGGQNVAQSGSEDEPLVVEIVKKLQGEAPTFPDEDPLQPCPKKDAAEDAPDGGDPFADTGGSDKKPAKPVKPKKLWARLALHQDLAFLSGSDVCSLDSQRAGDFYCFRQDDGAQYQGNPQAGKRNSIQGGFVPATTRVLLGVDYTLRKKVGIGGAVGYAFRGGGPTPSQGSDFLPVHFELRGSYFLLGEGPPTRGAGVAAFVVTGLAQVDGKHQVAVHEDTSVQVPPEGQQNPPGQNVDAWKRMGRVFGGGGATVYYGVGGGALAADLRVLMMLGASGLVASPGVAYAMGF
jgi:hypothetical protein